MELTYEGRHALVNLIMFRIREGRCACEIMERQKLKLPCSLCRILESIKKQFPNEYFAACELVAKMPKETH